MPRKPLIRSNLFPFHVTNRVNNREWYQLKIPEVWRIFAECWKSVAEKTGAQAHAFILMSNHFHLIVSTPKLPIDVVMREFSRSVSKTYNRESGRCGHLFNARYVPNLIEDSRYYSTALKYIFRNPVRAGLAENVEDYEFSTLHTLLGQNGPRFPIHPTAEGAGDALIPNKPKDLLLWLNTPFANEEQSKIQKALRKRVFTLPGSDPVN